MGSVEPPTLMDRKKPRRHEGAAQVNGRKTNTAIICSSRGGNVTPLEKKGKDKPSLSKAVKYR